MRNAPGSLGEVDTPAPLVERSRLAANIEAMQRFADESGVRLRPHVKTHKSPRLAFMQMRAGAVGIAVAKVSEAEVMAGHGITDIQITSEIVGEAKLARVAALAGSVRLACAVDSLRGAAGLSAACAAHGAVVDVLVEINSGLNRCGLSEFDEIAALSKAVLGMPGLRLSGIMTHAGHAYAAGSPEETSAIGREEGQIMARLAKGLRARGIPLDAVSVGSTPTVRHSGLVDGVTEIRPGNYIFNDMIQVSLGVASIEQCALTVLATVISTPARGRAVIDAGSKTLALDKGAHGSALLTGHGHIIGKRATLARLSEEHGIIEYEHGTEGAAFEIGERIRIIPNHACPVMNLFDHAWLVDGEEVVKRIGIEARGMVR